MKMSVVPNIGGLDRYIRAGEHKGQSCHYKSALYSCLLQFRPKCCLEIGTHTGGTTGVFHRYFNECMSDGFLVTLDVRHWDYPQSLKNDNRIRRVLVSPHKPEDESSIENNISLIRRVMDEVGILVFDFCFVDGHHTETDYLRDLEIVRSVSSPSCPILLDDVKEGLHECKRVYEDKTRHEFEHYEFEDWPVFVGCALIRRK